MSSRWRDGCNIVWERLGGLNLVGGINDSEKGFRLAQGNRRAPATQDCFAEDSNALMNRFLIFCFLMFSVFSSLANTLVLVSIDGCRWDYSDWPVAQRMDEQGVWVN